MRNIVTVIAAMVLSYLVFVGVAKAHWIAPIKKNESPAVKIRKAKMNIRHGRTAVRYLRRNPSGTYKMWKKRIRNHIWLEEYNEDRVEILRWMLPPPHYFQWLCIHDGEGSWKDANDPYWGGLQMDRDFMRSYAPRRLLRKGWANTWTPLEQMWVAETAYASGRGFYPWPNTARECGLI